MQVGSRGRRQDPSCSADLGRLKTCTADVLLSSAGPVQPAPCRSPRGGPFPSEWAHEAASMEPHQALNHWSHSECLSALPGRPALIRLPDLGRTGFALISKSTESLCLNCSTITGRLEGFLLSVSYACTTLQRRSTPHSAVQPSPSRPSSSRCISLCLPHNSLLHPAPLQQTPCCRSLPRRRIVSPPGSKRQEDATVPLQGKCRSWHPALWMHRNSSR